MLGRKKKKPDERIEMKTNESDESQEEEEQMEEGLDELYRGKEEYDASEGTKEDELPNLPPRKKEEKKRSKLEEDISVPEYFDVIEGNIKRAFVALSELRKITGL